MCQTFSGAHLFIFNPGEDRIDCDSRALFISIPGFVPVYLNPGATVIHVPGVRGAFTLPGAPRSFTSPGCTPGYKHGDS